MPEKPEVITVSNSLRPRLVGKKITGCNVYWDNIIAYPTTDEFKKEIIGQNDSIVKHEHVEFILDDDISFRYHDVRKFGKMYLIDKDKVDNVKPLSELGYEFDDSDLTKEYLYEKLHNKKLPIKTVLLDQSIITGIGNIYDDEILFRSKISPYRKSCDISVDECDEIIKDTRLVLKEAIKKGGTTIKSFTSSEGVHGLFQNELLVHGKKKGICPNCSSSIEVCRIAGRGTYYCPKCQK